MAVPLHRLSELDRGTVPMDGAVPGQQSQRCQGQRQGHSHEDKRCDGAREVQGKRSTSKTGVPLSGTRCLPLFVY